ncbi:MAG: fibronectin type III domain-containing protein, partial [Chloroflexi bacterium]|nr:fibronectin type III domain-containing protein [Chloroflexota bacterium]
MPRRSNLRCGIACLIAGLLLIATACEAERNPPAPATLEPAAESTSPPMPTPTSTPTAAPVGEVRELRLSSPARGMLRISWTHADPAPTDYHVSWAKLSDDFRPPTDDAGNAYPSVASHVVTGLDAGTMYKVRVRARRQDGSDEDSIRTGPWSATEAVRVIAPPFAPTGLTAVATHRGVVLEWDDPGDDTITSYELVRIFEDRFGGSHVVQTWSAETHYVDTDVLYDLGYVYTLHAVNSFGKGQASESVSVTTLARIPGRDYLYKPISPPMAPAYAEWYWERGHDRLREVIVDFTIRNDVGDWSDENSYYLILMQNSISGAAFYFGLQSDVQHVDNRLGQVDRGKGAIFSRWGTRNLANARAAPTDGWTESSGHEGDFIGVRREYDWSAGDYRARIAPDGLGDDGEW